MTKRLYPSVSEVLTNARKGTVQTRKSRRLSQVIETPSSVTVSTAFDPRAIQARIDQSMSRNPALFGDLG